VSIEIPDSLKERYGLRRRAVRVLAVGRESRLAEGCSNAEIGERLGMRTKAVGRWRRRFDEHRLEGLPDETR
jgi:transposase